MPSIPDLAPPWQRVALVHDTTDLFEAETMTALDDRYAASGGAGTVPDGGTIGQVLAKDSSTDQDVSWQDQSTSGAAPVNVIAATGSTETLSYTYQLHKITMDANCTFDFTAPVTGGAVFAVLLSGAYVPTWPGAVDWPDGTVPTYTSPSLYVFATFDGGTTWEGVQSGKAFA